MILSESETLVVPNLIMDQAMSERAIEAAAISRAIEDFIAEPQCERDYRGSIAPGFEMRRDQPKHFGPGIWFSDVAVKAILAALAAAQRVTGEDAEKSLREIVAAFESGHVHIDSPILSTEYGPHYWHEEWLHHAKAALALSPGKVEGWREAIEAAAKCAEQEVDTYYEGMSAIDVRLSNRRGPKWHDGRAIAKAIRALPSPPISSRAEDSCDQQPQV